MKVIAYVYDSSGTLITTPAFGNTVYVYFKLIRTSSDIETLVSLDTVRLRYLPTASGVTTTVDEVNISDCETAEITTSDYGTVTCYVYTIPLSAMETICPDSTKSSSRMVSIDGTYTSSATTGTASGYFFDYVSVPSSVKPTLNLTVSEGNSSMPAALKDIVFVQNQSKLRAVSGASGAYGSSVTSCIITVDGVTYASALSVTSGTITTAGTVTVSCTVKDSRSRTATASTTVTVLAYSNPSLTGVTAYRCTGAADPTADRSGAYIVVYPVGAVTALSSHNAKTCTVYYKKTSASSYTTASVSMSDYTLDTEYVIFAADTDASYDLYVILADSIGNTKYICTQVPAAGAYIDIPEDGLGMGIGKKLEGTGLEIGWDTKISGSLSFIGELTGGNPADVADDAPFVWTASIGAAFCPICKVPVADGHLYFGYSPADSVFEMVHIDSNNVVTVKQLSMT